MFDGDGGDNYGVGDGVAFDLTGEGGEGVGGAFQRGSGGRPYPIMEGKYQRRFFFLCLPVLLDVLGC